ncbi:hypothetical protein [Streptomyces sioyaensis]|uniref:hypothetical protein n=1 Tax=Streptomyces sioyaensis TaxID=67364 RepID=UPI003D723B40
MAVGVCSHCIRLVDLDDEQRVASHLTYMWLWRDDEHPEMGLHPDPPAKPSECPGARLWPIPPPPEDMTE